MRIAFFSLNAYDMLTGGHRGNAGGGAQLQQILIGRELATRGHDIHFIEYDADTKQEQAIDGIQIHTVAVPQGSAPRRALQVTATTRRVLNAVDPDVCYRRVLDFGVIPLSWLSRLLGCRFVYGVAHDDELSDDPHMFADGIKSTRLFRRAIRRSLSNAAAVITQNEHQRDLAEDRLTTSVFKIPNCYPAETVDPIDWEHEPPTVFWAARFEPWKRPELVAELAVAFPTATFVMAGRPGDEALYADIEAREETLDNLVLTGHIPIADIDRYFAAADVFLNTSVQEGFPNTFLQAWAQGTPVVSFQADPDGIIQTHDIGYVAGGSPDTLSEQVGRLIDDPDDRHTRGTAGREYFESNHTVEAVADAYEAVFESVTAGPED